jgi:maltose/moltooligosaccharide transporter
MRSFGIVTETGKEAIVIRTPASRFAVRGIIWLLIGGILSLSLYLYNRTAEAKLEKELYVLTLGIAAFGLLQLFAFVMRKNESVNGFVEVMDDMNFLPDTMKKLAVVQFFSWFALFSMWIYSTPALALHISGTSDTTSVAYNKMANWVGVLFAFYNGFAALFAFLLPVMAKRLSRPPTHMIALFAGGLGLVSFYLFKNENLLVVSMAGIGLAWCSILAMPYAMLTQTLPASKMGVYMGIFNFFIVIPQILAATILGFLTNHLFNGHPIFTIVTGGCSMILAGLLTLRIKDKVQ